MNRPFKILIFLLIAAGSFLAGYWVNHESGGNKPAEEGRILFYMDPMNPAYKSDKPGISPSCGMPLEPVYADNGGSVTNGSNFRESMPPGTIRVSLEKQQLIGVKVIPVEKAPWIHTLRVLGRVTPDETLVYRVNAAINGWIEEVLPVTTGALVKKDELLATFSSLEYRTLMQSYFNLIKSSNPGSPGAKAEDPPARLSVPQIKQTRDMLRSLGQGAETSQADYYKKNLFNYGVSEYQLEEMERTRKIPDVIEIRAPAAGFILFRNVSPGLRFDRGAEFFRIADLSRVWINADVFENEASFFKPGLRVKMELPYQKKTLYARMSDVLPQFDPATRTLKIRLEADNPGYALRPDMFVNVEISVSGPAAIIVPTDAVVDSGLKKTVFVDRGNGYFEPRQVETGRSLGERVEILRGLISGEKIVVSGNFLIDSEARMQQATAGITGKIGRDPVCGMNIDEDRARAEGNFLEYRGRTYFFCDPKGREDFRKEPERYLKSSPAAQTDIPPSGTKAKAAVDHTSHGTMERTEPDSLKAGHLDHDGMKTAKPKDLVQTMPGQGTGMAMPGLQGTASMPSQMPGGLFPPASGTVRMMPGTQEGSSVPQPTSLGIISPGASPDMTARPMNTTDGGHAHD